MKCTLGRAIGVLASAFASSTLAGQVPGASSSPDYSISHRDRLYAAEQFSNTVSVTDPADNRLLGVIRLGEPQPVNFSPLYRGQLLVHGLGYSPDHKTIAVVSIGSNSVTFIDTQTNAIKHTTYLGRAPHEAFYTPNGAEVWVTVRGEDYVSVIDAATFQERLRIRVPNGPGMQIFSPDGRYGYVCSSFTPETVVIAVDTHAIVGRVKQFSPFCPNIAANPDGNQVWFTLKDVGKVQVFDAHPPFAMLKSLDTGPITNHVNFAHRVHGTFAYVTVGALNLVKVFRTDTFAEIAQIPVGALPHGIWPSGDGSRMYVGLENDDALVVIDTTSNTIVARSVTGQAPQAIAYVPNAVSTGSNRQGLTPLDLAGGVTRLSMAPPTSHIKPWTYSAHTSVSLFDQGLTQILEASVAGLAPSTGYVLALSDLPDGSGTLQLLSAFTTNPAGAAIVTAVGPIRQLVAPRASYARQYLVIAQGNTKAIGRIVQVQLPHVESNAYAGID